MASQIDFPSDMSENLPLTATRSSETSFRDLDDCYCATAFEPGQHADKALLAFRDNNRLEGESDRVETWIEATAAALAVHATSEQQCMTRENLLEWHAADIESLATSPPPPDSVEDQQEFPYVPILYYSWSHTPSQSRIDQGGLTITISGIGISTNRRTLQVISWQMS